MQIYTFNNKTLKAEPLSLRAILFIPVMCVLATVFNVVYYRAPLIKDWEYTYKEGKLIKETVYLTLEECIGDR